MAPCPCLEAKGCPAEGLHALVVRVAALDAMQYAHTNRLDAINEAVEKLEAGGPEPAAASGAAASEGSSGSQQRDSRPAPAQAAPPLSTTEMLEAMSATDRTSWYEQHRMAPPAQQPPSTEPTCMNCGAACDWAGKRTASCTGWKPQQPRSGEGVR